MKGKTYTEKHEICGAVVNHTFQRPDICDLCGSEDDLMKCEDCGVEVCRECYKVCDICGQRFCKSCEAEAQQEGGGVQKIEYEDEEEELHICYDCSQKDWRKELS